MFYDDVKNFTKILMVLRYGIIYNCNVYKICNLYYDEYINEYVFLCEDDSYFLLNDIDDLYRVNVC